MSSRPGLGMDLIQNLFLSAGFHKFLCTTRVSEGFASHAL